MQASGDVVLRVTDDGGGLPAGAVGSGHGLVNVQTPARQLGGTFEAVGGPGGATTVEWCVPAGPAPPG